jgi:hypothetical protein
MFFLLDDAAHDQFFQFIANWGGILEIVGQSGCKIGGFEFMDTIFGLE